MSEKNKIEVGIFGPIYRQFKNKPVEAIKHLNRLKDGDCVDAIYRKDIGFIDIIWGEVTDPIKHKGYGLAHIIDKHGKDIESLGFSIEQFIPTLILYGDLDESKQPDKLILKGHNFKVVISKKAYKNEKIINKTFVLTSFSMIKK